MEFAGRPGPLLISGTPASDIVSRGAVDSPGGGTGRCTDAKGYLLCFSGFKVAQRRYDRRAESIRHTRRIEHRVEPNGLCNTWHWGQSRPGRVSARYSSNGDIDAEGDRPPDCAWR